MQIRYILIAFLIVFTLEIFSQPANDPNFSETQLVTQTPTYLNIAEAKHVLVVYKIQNNSQDTIGLISTQIKDYYKNARGIPSSNIIALSLKDTIINNHIIRLVQNGEIIKDTTQAWEDRSGSAGATNHAWQYFESKVFIPVQTYLRNTIVNGDTLKNTIRYIVLCKGIPTRIQARYDWSGIGFYNRWNVALDPLLCFLNQDNINFNITSFYGTSYSSQFNPYRYIDELYSLDYRFKSKYFQIDTQLKLSYLVSRLDGLTKEKVIDMINKSVQSDYSGNGIWIFDSHYFGSSINYYNQFFEDAHNELINLGFTSVYDNLNTSPILSNSNPIMGYISWGKHAGFLRDYIIDSLEFQYKNGAIVNTLNSFNGTTMGIYYNDRNIKRDEQGLISEFIYVGATGGPCHTWEPYLGTAVRVDFTYPHYAMGYGLVDAVYMGMPILGWQNVVIGDPLTTIAWGKQTITQNLTWSGTNLVTGEVTIPSGKTLTIQNNSTVRLRHQGILGGAGILNIGSNVTVNTNDWSRSVLLNNSAFNPKLLWAAHPSFTLTNYRVYRAISSRQATDPSTLSYQLIYTSPNSSTYEYTDVDIHISSGSYVYYYVTAFRLINPKSGYGIESGRSNYTSTRGDIYKRAYNNSPIDQELDYSLKQNYPNPFNPITQIKYSLKENAFVTMKVFDILGREIITLINQTMTQGEHFIDFDASELSSGVYIYQLKANNYIASKKMIISK